MYGAGLIRPDGARSIGPENVSDLTGIRMGDTIHIPSFRATFVWFD